MAASFRISSLLFPLAREELAQPLSEDWFVLQQQNEDDADCYTDHDPQDWGRSQQNTYQRSAEQPDEEDRDRSVVRSHFSEC